MERTGRMCEQLRCIVEFRKILESMKIRREGLLVPVLRTDTGVLAKKAMASR